MDSPPARLARSCPIEPSPPLSLGCRRILSIRDQYKGTSLLFFAARTGKLSCLHPLLAIIHDTRTYAGRECQAFRRRNIRCLFKCRGENMNAICLILKRRERRKPHRSNAVQWPNLKKRGLTSMSTHGKMKSHHDEYVGSSTKFSVSRQSHKTVSCHSLVCDSIAIFVPRTIIFCATAVCSASQVSSSRKSPL